MQEYVLYTRKDQEFFNFRGDVLALATDREWMMGDEAWMKLALYKSDEGKYVLSSSFYLKRPGKNYLQDARVFSSVEDVYVYLLLEGEGVESVVDNLLEQAAQNDEQFSGILQRSRHKINRKKHVKQGKARATAAA